VIATLVPDMLTFVTSARARVLIVMLAAAAAYPAAAQSLRSKQPARLTVAAEPPASVVAGTPFTVVLRLTPAEGVHVYAPGNPNYIPVAVEITPSPGLKTDAAVFPAGQDLFFGPLKESVKVYSAPFVVKLPVSLDAKVVKAGDVLVRGIVSYQACNDRVCFPPQSAPFEARLSVKRRRS
jgi:DsbC/DsbD-like thiol-disulfide interchange protein